MADEEGVRVVLSPTQLAAVLVGAPISPDQTMNNRLWGVAKVVGGGLELLGAAGLALVPEPTLATKAGAVVLAGHGGDTLGTGLRQVWTGETEKTNTQRAAAGIARAVGAEEGTAETIGVVVDIAVPIAVAGVVGASRVIATRAGRLSLIEEETAGGHTVARHIAKTEAELRARLLAQPGIPAASTFKTLAAAEGVIANGLKANAAAIQTWASTAGTANRLAFVYDAGKPIGEGVVRATGLLTQMQRVQIVLEKSTVAGKLYYILTAYPKP